MRNQLLLCLFSATLVGGSTYRYMSEPALGKFQLETQTGKENSKLSKAQNAKDAAQWRYDRLKDENGNFYYSYYTQAVKQADAFRSQRHNRSTLGLRWEELGPDNVGGRTRAILIDKRDPSDNTIYAGGVGGGMWKSLDAGNTWNRLPNWMSWLAVSCITQGPDNTIYIGTGEGLSNPNGSSLNSGTTGNGIFKLDGNDNPIQITPDNFADSVISNNDAWAIVNRIAVNPQDANNIVAATGKGVFLTTDGGVNWDPIQAPPGVAGSASDVKWSADGIDIFASAGGNNKLIVSRNGGFQWQRITNTSNPGFPTVQGRVEIALAPSFDSIMYVAVANSAGCTYGVYRSADAGNTWTAIGLKGPLFDPFTAECQGWYDNTIAVSPADPNKVYMGGVDFYTWSDQSGWKLADAGLGAGETNPNYIHPDKHAITISTHNPNTMYVGCDGGIYKSTNAITAFPYPNYVVKNRGYNVTQNYSVAAAITGEVMGGSQDNGTNYIDFQGNTRMASRMVIGGDGIFAEISHVDPRIMFGGIYFGEVLRSGNKSSSFDAFYDIKIDPQGFTQPSRCGGQKDQNAPFITPFYLSETKDAWNGIRTVPFIADRNYNAGETITVQSKTAKYPFAYTLNSNLNSGDTLQVNDPVRSRVFVTSNCGVFETSDALDLGIIPRWFKLTSSLSGLVNAYAATSSGDMMYVATSAGNIYRFSGLNSRCDTTAYPPGSTSVGLIYRSNSQYFTKTVTSGRSIEGIAVDPNDSMHVVVGVAGFSTNGAPHVYESFDGGSNWSPLTNGLPNMPVYSVVIRNTGSIIIGTELGVWSWDGFQWNEENDGYLQQNANGLPRMPVYKLIEKELYTDNCPVLYIGTHGRGMWRSTTLTPQTCNTTTAITEVKNATGVSGLNVYPNPVQSSSKISLMLDKNDDVTLRIFDMTGKLYKETTYRNTTSGENIFELDASGLSNGTYLVSATAANVRTQSRLFVVAR